MKIALTLSTFLSGWTLLTSASAIACPSNLQHNSFFATPGLTLCEVYDRYHDAADHLRANGTTDVRRIGNLMAPRFINLPDWLSKRSSRPDSALMLYTPAPTTWADWEREAAEIDARAKKNFESGKFAQVELNDVIQINKNSLNGLLDTAGVFRAIDDAGPQILVRTALTQRQVLGIQTVKYPQIRHPELPLVRYEAVDCLETKPAADQMRIIQRFKSGGGIITNEWAPIANDKFFVAQDGVKKQCGFIKYSPHEEIPAQLAKYLENINAFMSVVMTGRADINPLSVAARAQRWMVSIHPFYDGNGRLSRYMMDLTLESLGLPAPILLNMDNDVYSSEEQWAAEIGRGLERAVLAAEDCAADSTQMGCSEIATTPGAP